MAGRGQLPSGFERRATRARGMMRHGPPPGIGPSHHPLGFPPHDYWDPDMVAQEEEMQRLDRENYRLVATHVTMRDEIAAIEEEIETVKAHIGSTETESDIQIRILHDKTAKLEDKIRTADSRKKDLQQMRMEAQRLVSVREELTNELQEATDELKKTNAEIQALSELIAEFDRSREEHQRLRATFGYEKRLNMEKVEKLRTKEKKLIDLTKEAETLRAAISDAENRARSPHRYGATYMYKDSLYPPTVHSSGAYGYGESYRIKDDTRMGIVAASGSSRASAAASGGGGGSTAPGAAAAWGGELYTPTHPTS